MRSLASVLCILCPVSPFPLDHNLYRDSLGQGRYKDFGRIHAYTLHISVARMTSRGRTRPLAI